jgi:hypothetical protein
MIRFVVDLQPGVGQEAVQQAGSALEDPQSGPDGVP